MAKKTKQKNGEVPPEIKAEIQGEEKALQPAENIFNPDGELVVDVFETGNDFVVLAAIAGIQIQDIDISVEKDLMVIKGQRKNPELADGKTYFYQECYWGPFSRKIVLPENLDTESAQAQMDKGMLTIKIPKAAPAPKEEIKIS